MTQPICRVPGQTSFITRRTASRMACLRPSTFNIETLGYWLAIAAERYQITVSAFVAMSNHVHMIVHDPHAKRGDFMGVFFSATSRDIKKHLELAEGIWDKRAPNDVALLDENAVIREIAYVLANPVKAGLVALAKEFPGLMIGPEHWGIPLTFPRPFWGPRSMLPRYATIVPKPPPFTGFVAIGLADRVFGYLEEAERKAAERHKKKGTTPWGAQACLDLDPYYRPSPRVSDKPSAPPKFAGTPERIRDAKAYVAMFHAQRAAASQRQRDGEVGVVFPLGTVRLPNGTTRAPLPSPRQVDPSKVMRVTPSAASPVSPNPADAREERTAGTKFVKKPRGNTRRRKNDDATPHDHPNIRSDLKNSRPLGRK